MTVVIDCNVIVSAGINDGFVRHVLRGAISKYTVIVSADIIAEYSRVADYPKFSAEASATMKRTITQIEERARFVETDACDVTLPDPDDVRYVEAAIAGEADFIITGNLKHFPEREYGLARVVSVREFAELAGLIR